MCVIYIQHYIYIYIKQNNNTRKRNQKLDRSRMSLVIPKENKITRTRLHY